jgi:hypothetical protein
MFAITQVKSMAAIVAGVQVNKVSKSNPKMKVKISVVIMYCIVCTFY